MGNTLSLTEAQLEEISKYTTYSSQEISSIYFKFSKLDRKEKGYVSVEDFSQICDFEENPINKRVIETLVSGLSSNIDFRTLISHMASFEKGDNDKKLECKK